VIRKTNLKIDLV